MMKTTCPQCGHKFKTLQEDYCQQLIRLIAEIDIPEDARKKLLKKLYTDPDDYPFSAKQMAEKAGFNPVWLRKVARDLETAGMALKISGKWMFRPDAEIYLQTHYKRGRPRKK